MLEIVISISQMDNNDLTISRIHVNQLSGVPTPKEINDGLVILAVIDRISQVDNFLSATQVDAVKETMIAVRKELFLDDVDTLSKFIYETKGGVH